MKQCQPHLSRWGLGEAGERSPVGTAQIRSVFVCVVHKGLVRGGDGASGFPTLKGGADVAAVPDGTGGSAKWRRYSPPTLGSGSARLGARARKEPIVHVWSEYQLVLPNENPSNPCPECLTRKLRLAQLGSPAEIQLKEGLSVGAVWTVYQLARRMCGPRRIRAATCWW